MSSEGGFNGSGTVNSKSTCAESTAEAIGQAEPQTPGGSDEEASGGLRNQVRVVVNVVGAKEFSEEIAVITEALRDLQLKCVFVTLKRICKVVDRCVDITTTYEVTTTSTLREVVEALDGGRSL